MRNKEIRKIIRTYTIKKEDEYWFRAALRRSKYVKCLNTIKAGKEISVLGTIDDLEAFELQWI